MPPPPTPTTSPSPAPTPGRRKDGGAKPYILAGAVGAAAAILSVAFAALRRR